MRLTIRILDLAGTLLLLIGVENLLLDVGFACYTLTLGTWRLNILAADDVSRLQGLMLLWPVATFVDSGCGSAAGKAAVVAELLARDIPLAILSAVPVTVAWILCLVQLVRTGHRGVAVTLALVLPLLASVSLWLFHFLSLGTWRLDILAADDVSRLQGLMLLWPVATFVATFALRKR